MNGTKENQGQIELPEVLFNRVNGKQVMVVQSGVAVSIKWTPL